MDIAKVACYCVMDRFHHVLLFTLFLNSYTKVSFGRQFKRSMSLNGNVLAFSSNSAESLVKKRKKMVKLKHTTK